MDDSPPIAPGAALSGAASAADRGLVLIKAGIADCAGEDLAGVDGRALLDDVVALHVQLEALRGAWLSRIAEIDRRQAAAVEEGAASTASWLRGACLIPGAAAAAAVRVARRLAGLPHLAAALADGRVGFDAAQLITRVLSPARLERAAAAGADAAALEAVETALVGLAEVTDPARLRGELARVVEHLDAAPADAADGAADDAADGAGHGARAGAGADEGQSELYASKTLDDVVHITGRFDAVDGAALLAALDATSAPVGVDDTRTPAQRRAAGLIDLIQRALAGGTLPANGGERPHVGVLVPVGVLTREDGRRSCRHLARLVDAVGRPGTATGGAPTAPGAGAVGRDGARAWLTQTGPISSTAAQLLACDAIVHRIVLGPDSIPLDVGRSVRIVPAALRRALLVRDQGCAFPGCDRPAGWCQAHHIRHWSEGGETSLDNCVLLCRFHHRLIHHTGWEVHAVPGGRPYFTRPGGLRYEGPRLPRAG